MIDKAATIYVAGHTGLVGSALLRALKKDGFRNILTRTHRELDLTSQIAVNAFFKAHQPEYVFLAAAKVGGIWANENFPADFIQQNLQIQNNVILAAKEANVKRLLLLGSSCIYPRDCPQPIKEEYLLTGPLESTNRPYALAKIAGIEMCWAFNRQYGTQYLAVMPTNLYGPGDNFDLNNSHVIPALIRKMHEAKLANQQSVEIWGTGKPRREFMYSDDLAQACVFLLNLDEAKYHFLINSNTMPPLINVGCGKDLTISMLAQTIANVVGFEGTLQFNASYSDGTPQKCLDISRLQALGWTPQTQLENGLTLAYEAFQEKYVHHSPSVL